MTTDPKRTKIALTADQLDDALRAFARNIARYFPKEDRSEAHGQSAAIPDDSDFIAHTGFRGMLIDSGKKLTAEEEQRFIDTYVAEVKENLRGYELDDEGNYKKTGHLDEIHSIKKDYNLEDNRDFLPNVLKKCGLGDRTRQYIAALPEKTQFKLNESGLIESTERSWTFEATPIQPSFIPEKLNVKQLLADEKAQFAVVKRVGHYHIRLSDKDMVETPANQAQAELIKSYRNESATRDNETYGKGGDYERTGYKPKKQIEKYKPKVIDLPLYTVRTDEKGAVDKERYSKVMEGIETPHQLVESVDENTSRKILEHTNTSYTTPEDLVAKLVNRPAFGYPKDGRDLQAIHSQQDPRYRAYATRQSYLATKLENKATVDTRDGAVILEKGSWVIIDPTKKTVVDYRRSEEMVFGVDFKGQSSKSDYYQRDMPAFALCDTKGKMFPDMSEVSAQQLPPEMMHSGAEITIAKRKDMSR